jgi:hypothetical protein
MDLTVEAPSKTAAKTITLVAYSPKTQLPIKARPMEDSSGMCWTGQGKNGYYDLLTKDEKEDLPYIITRDTHVLLEDGKVLNIETNPVDKANWVWLQKHPYIAVDREAGDQRVARFYVADAEKDAAFRVDDTELVDKARYEVRQLSLEKLTHLAKVLGLGAAESFSQKQILDWVLGKATSKETVKAVLDAINPENKAKSNATIFFNEIHKWGVIERGKDGVFYFGGENGVNLGINPDQVIGYLLAKENSERVQAMKTMLTEKKKTA